MQSRRMARSRSPGPAGGSSGPVALLLTEASRTRVRSMTELECFRPRPSLCLKCGQAAELCMPCSNRIAKGAVQLYRQARLDGSTNILKARLVLRRRGQSGRC